MDTIISSSTFSHYKIRDTRHSFVSRIGLAQNPPYHLHVNKWLILFISPPQVLNGRRQPHHGAQQARSLRRHGPADVALLHQLLAQHLLDGSPADGQVLRRDLQAVPPGGMQVSWDWDTGLIRMRVTRWNANDAIDVVSCLRSNAGHDLYPDVCVCMTFSRETHT